MDWQNPASLARRDSFGLIVMQAVAPGLYEAVQSHATPGSYICEDSKTYWLKSKAQHGLSAELIAGRLAACVGVGPGAQVIWLKESIARLDEARLVGLVVGSEDVPGTVNARELSPWLKDTDLGALIDPSSRARVIAFQTWLGANDSQVLVSIRDGRVLSIDHGDCFGAVTDPPARPTLVVTEIPGINQDVGRGTTHVQHAIGRIESVTDEDILRAVAQIPADDISEAAPDGIWNSDKTRRLAIGRWLAMRRPMVRGVMEQWMK